MKSVLKLNSVGGYKSSSSLFSQPLFIVGVTLHWSYHMSTDILLEDALS